jgi:flagellar hook-basal body complex protein FliE
MMPISGPTLAPVTTAELQAARPSGPAESGFAGMLGGVVGQAEGLETQAESQVTQLANGTGDIAKTMLTLQEATLAVGLLAQVRDRVVSAYQSLMSEAV